MAEWKRARLGEILEFQRGYDLPHSKMVAGEYPVIGSSGIIGWHNEYTTESPSISIGRSGSIGRPFIYKGKSWSHNTALYIKDFKGNEPRFIYYFLFVVRPWDYGSGSAVPTLNRNDLHDIEVSIPPLATQKKIAAVLGAIDDKIETNRKICANLEAQAQALFKSWFVDSSENVERIVQMQEAFEVTIGRTPPRKEFKWFSECRGDNVVWVSIADMGGCGTFIADSSEYLTKEAVERFCLNIVPKDTVLLSFKLTVGRVAIAATNLVTNEAIAHLRTSDSLMREYLYCYLGQFNYDTLGSTSSIATAVNSKTIREMPFAVPKRESLKKFHDVAANVFDQIREMLSESRALASMRDALLPRLMSGEIDVEKVEVA